MSLRTPPHADRWRVALFAAVLTALSGCSSGPPQVLRGPPPRKGEASRTETKMTMENGKFSSRTLGLDGTRVVGFNRREGTCAMSMTSVEEDEVLEVEDGQVTKLRTTIVTEDGSQTLEIDGEKDTQTERGPLAGETILRERKDGKWKNTLVGKTPTDAQRKELESLPPPEDNDDLLPEGPVKPGFTWKIDADRLRKLVGPRCSSLTGESSMKFLRTEAHGGEPCALIHVTMSVKGKLLEAGSNTMSVEVNARGTIYRSLATGHDVKTVLSGMVKVAAAAPGEGVMSSEMSGPFTLESSTKPKSGAK